MLVPYCGHDGLTEGCKEQRSNKRPGHSPWEGEVVVAGQLLLDVGNGSAVYQDIVGGLDVERLFNFGVRGCQKMGYHHDHNEQVEENVYNPQVSKYGWC